MGTGGAVGAEYVGAGGAGGAEWFGADGGGAWLEAGPCQVLSSSLALITPADLADSVREGKAAGVYVGSEGCMGGDTTAGVDGSRLDGTTAGAGATSPLKSSALPKSMPSGGPGVGVVPSLIAFKMVAALYLQ